jgi:prepilin-type processing-associated H-X9-DG protein
MRRLRRTRGERIFTSIELLVMIAIILSGGVPGGYSLNRLGAGADGFASPHPGGCQLLLCDGSVRFVKETLAQQVFRALASRADGEVIGAEQF